MEDFHIAIGIGKHFLIKKTCVLSEKVRLTSPDDKLDERYCFNFQQR